MSPTPPRSLAVRARFVPVVRFLLLPLLALALLLTGLSSSGGVPAVAASTTPTVPSTDPVADPAGTDTDRTDRAAASGTGAPVVMVGVAGLTFEQIDRYRTPNLWSLVEDGSIGTVTPRSVRSTSCPVDGWLAVNSGRRAADEPRDECRAPGEPIENWVPDWAVYQNRVDADNYDAALGTLREAATTSGSADGSGSSIAAIGPGAYIAAADSHGWVDGTAPVSEDIGAQVGAALEDDGLVLVDLGNVREAGYSLTVLDEQIGEIRTAVEKHDAGTSVDQAASLLTYSLSDGWVDSSSMQFAAALGPDFAPGILSSASTKQPGLVQTTDVLPTVLGLLGARTTANLAGASMYTDVTGIDTQERVQLMLDRETAVETQADLSVWFFPVFGLILALLLLTVFLVGRKDLDRVTGPLRVLGAFFAAVPVSTYLVNVVPWERSTSPDVAMLAALVGWSFAIMLGALLGPWKRLPLGPVTFVAAVTVGVLLYDVLTGSALQMSTLMGEPLLIASRFYGIGNSALALYCTALVFVLVAACQHVPNRWVRLGVVLVGLTASAIVLGTPGLGTKFGSIPTLIVGLAVLALSAAEIRLTIKRVAIFGSAAVGVMLLLLVGDWLRPPEKWTHFGRFFDSILNGEAASVLIRKVQMNVEILTQSWMTLLLPFVIGAVFWVVLRPERFRVPYLPRVYAQNWLLRPGILSLLVLLVVGTFINDSGIVVPAVGILFLVPAVGHLVGQQAYREAKGLGSPSPATSADGSRTPE